MHPAGIGLPYSPFREYTSRPLPAYPEDVLQLVPLHVLVELALLIQDAAVSQGQDHRLALIQVAVAMLDLRQTQQRSVLGAGCENPVQRVSCFEQHQVPHDLHNTTAGAWKKSAVCILNAYLSCQIDCQKARSHVPPGISQLTHAMHPNAADNAIRSAHTHTHTYCDIGQHITCSQPDCRGASRFWIPTTVCPEVHLHACQLCCSVLALVVRISCLQRARGKGQGRAATEHVRQDIWFIDQVASHCTAMLPVQCS